MERPHHRPNSLDIEHHLATVYDLLDVLKIDPPHTEKHYKMLVKAAQKVLCHAWLDFCENYHCRRKS